MPRAAMTIRPARIDFGVDPPRSLDFGDVYHPASGPRGQSAHVFLGGNGLPERWRGRSDFSILETGFGLGHNFLATWQAWRNDPLRSERLHFVSLDAHPPSQDDLKHAHALAREKQRAEAAGKEHRTQPAFEPALPEVDARLRQALIAQWPPCVAGLHLRLFDEGRVHLLLGWGDAATLLPRVIGRFDAFFLDGFAPKVNPGPWTPRLLKGLGRLAAPEATVATWCAARSVREGLAAAGFAVSRARGFDRKRDMTRAVFAPRAPTQPPPGRPAGAWAGTRRAVIIGAGLAGAGVAQALARRGWQCTVLDGQDHPAQGASGNPAGLFHAVIHQTDNLYARLHRAAALLAYGHYAPLVRDGLITGAVDGLVLRHAAGAPDGLARTLDADQARACSGVWNDGPALLLPQAGWIDPAGLVRHWLKQPGVEFRGGVSAAFIEPPAHLGESGLVRDAKGHTIGDAPLIVLANGTGLVRWQAQGWLDLPSLPTTRGQLTWMAHPGRLLRPVSGDGYALSLPDGRLVCGATSQPDDPGSESDAPLREEDHRWNLERLARLTGWNLSCDSVERGEFGGDDAPCAVGGRAQWRLNTPDRLPLIGPVPAAPSPHERQDQARFVRRIPGLFVASAFGSRGLCWAPLAGELIASWVEGTPMALEADLVDALDPARWPVRRHRRRGKDGAAAAVAPPP